MTELAPTTTSPLPAWFSKPFPNHILPRRDFYICTVCSRQSCAGLYSSTCLKCRGVTSNPPHGIRSDYLCTDCARDQQACVCDRFSSPILTLSPSPHPPPECCCSCSWCNYVCECVCCCISCLCNTSTCQRCCSSDWKCSCCPCQWLKSFIYHIIFKNMIN